MASKSISETNLKPLPFHLYIAILLLIITFGISIYTLMEVRALKSAITPNAIPIEQLIKKLTAHDELKNYNNIPPLNIVKIDNANLGNLQTQIQGLDTSHIGKYIVQYTDRLVVYDFDNDKISGNLALQTKQEANLPQDFLTKLLSHPELKGTEKMNPSGGILDKASLEQLNQQYPDIYKNAKVGDYILRYDDRLIIYDYKNDNVVGTFALR